MIFEYFEFFWNVTFMQRVQYFDKRCINEVSLNSWLINCTVVLKYRLCSGYCEICSIKLFVLLECTLRSTSMRVGGNIGLNERIR